MTPFEKAHTFIYRNARPLDLARWRFLFEGGMAEDVMSTLAFYQNPDGGLGHGLEADSFNPESSPIQTWCGTEIIREISWKDGSHPVILGILRYLDSGVDFDEATGQWLNTVPSNNNYPCAFWWKWTGSSEFKYNPTAALAGFGIRYAEHDSVLYKKCTEIARQAYTWFCQNIPFEETHITGCFLTLYDWLTEADADIIDLNEFRELLIPQGNANICRNTEQWRTDYVTLPSEYIASADSILYSDNADLLREEFGMIPEMQGGDGAFSVPWQWYNDDEGFPLAENWWKAQILIRRMLPYRNIFGGM